MEKAMGNLSADRLRDQLRSLRRGSGVDVSKIQDCPAVLAAFVTTNPAYALEALRRHVDLLAAGARGQALQNTYGWGEFSDPRTEARRERFARSVGRQPVTIYGWENDAIDELVLRLMNLIEPMPDLSSAVFGALVEDRRLTKLVISQVFVNRRTDEAEARDAATHYNGSPDESIPCLLFQMPHDWRPSNLNFDIAFRGPEPESVSLMKASSLWGFVTLQAKTMTLERRDTDDSWIHYERLQVPFRDDMPVDGDVFGFYWTWGRSDDSGLQPSTTDGE